MRPAWRRVNADAFREFIDALCRREPDACARLFADYWARPYGRARSITGDDGDAHDVVASAFADFIERHAERFRGVRPAALQHYLMLAVTHRARRQVARRSRLRELVAEPASTGEAADTLALAQLERCLDDLPPRTREVVALRYGRDLDNHEIADRLGISRPAVNNHLTHPARGALGRLRRCLEGLAVEGTR